VQQRVYEIRVDNLDELKQRLIELWIGLGLQQNNFVDAADGEWRKRLRAYIRAHGQH